MATGTGQPNFPGVYGPQGVLCGINPPQGTSSSLRVAVSWSADIDGSTKGVSDSADWVGKGNADPWRTAHKFPLSSLSGKTVTSASVIVRVDGGGANRGSRTWAVGPYDGDGDGDPQTTDSAAVAFGKCDVSTNGNYATGLTNFRTNGLYVIQLGSSAVTDIQSLIDGAATSFTLAWQIDNESETNAYAAFTEFDESDPPTLVVGVS